MAKIISCVNLKGGVGKTALAVNLAAFFGRKKKKTLLIDLDPQTNATFSCITVEDWEDFSTNHGSLANLMGARSTGISKGQTKCSEVIKKSVFYNVDLIPSHLEMFTIDLDISGVVGREYVLAKAIDEVKEDYDAIVCDCPPNLTIPTQNAIAMSDYYVVPVSPDYLSGIGIALLLSRIERFCTDLRRPKIECAGIVLSRVGRPSGFRRKSTQSIRDEFPKLVLNNELRERSSVSESASKQMPIFDMGDTDAEREFRGACQEIFNNIEM